MSKARNKKGCDSKAVAYVRVSTEEQKLGPEAQKAAISDWASRNGVEIVAWFEDLGISGSVGLENRPGLAAALAGLRSFGAGRLLVAKRDRIARDVGLAIAVEKAAASLGGAVWSIDGTGNGTGDADAFLRRVIDAAAEYERALIRSRTKAALGALRASGKRAGTVPFGFVADAEGRLAPCPTEGATVARIEALRASGASQVAMVATLASEGHVGRTGRPLSRMQVQRILARV